MKSLTENLCPICHGNQTDQNHCFSSIRQEYDRHLSNITCLQDLLAQEEDQLRICMSLLSTGN